jgi:hypothetical protein
VLLRFFRINDPYRLLGLFIILILLGMPFFIDPAPTTMQELKSFVLGEAIREGKLMYVQVFDSTAPWTAGTFGLINWLFGRSLFIQHALALVLIFFQASFFAVLLIQNKAYNDNTYVPALVFGLLCFFSFDLLSFSPELLASTVLLLALNNLFKEIEFRIQRDEIILNLGVYLGVATLLIFSYVVFLFATILILYLFTRLSVRKLFLLLFGFVLPHALLITLYYFWGETTSLWQNFYVPNLTFHGMMFITLKSTFALCALPFGYFVFSLLMLNREARFTKYQSQLFQVMFQWMLFCLVQVWVSREFTPHSLIVFIPSLAYFISHYLLLIRRKWIADTMLWVFLIGIVAVNLLSRYNKMSRIDYTTLFAQESAYSRSIKNQRVMVLTDDKGVYQQNRLAGYFLDWDLSRKVLEEPDYYENVILVHQLFKSDPPETIIDPHGLMNKFFDRIPELKSGYRKDSVFYRRRSP